MTTEEAAKLIGKRCDGLVIDSIDCLGDPAWDLVFIYEDYGLDFLRRFLRGYESDDAPSLLKRVYRFHVLGAIEWAVERAERASAEIDEAVAQLSTLRTGTEEQLQELLSEL